MGFAETTLLNGEQIIYKSKLNWVEAFKEPMGAGVFAVICGFMGWMGAAATFFGIGILCLPLAFINYKSSEFVITNKRVLIKFGLIKRVSLEMLIDAIESVVFEQGIIDRMNKAGHVVIIGRGGTKQPLLHLDKPLEFRSKLQQTIEDYRTAKAS